MDPRAFLLLLSLSSLSLVSSQGDAPPLRQELLQRLNQARGSAGLMPLRLVPALSQVAQIHAEEAGYRSSSRLIEGSDVVWRRLNEVGYTAHTWSESVIVSPDGPEEVVDRWLDERRVPGGMTPAFQDVGIGIAEYRGFPLYVLLFGWHRGDYFAKQTAGLKDLDRVREDMIVRVNALRSRAGLRPVRRNPKLEAAAQAHAVDLLVRSDYRHESRDGRDQGMRAVAAGYSTSSVAENLYEDVYSVDEAVEGWLRSPGHRRNLLDPACTDLGLGVALGDGYGLDKGAYRVVWVQDFGCP